ncbi:efflux RND transporter permease subunit [Clostridium brassicae]|uniref:Efflux RND transporter permease subunit n=1 Tax=Clostridium brassicae TaxID=2999072 RepID=A0ABT4DAN7_9CLOT|nr:efflux RND transporter permease subunit [Clostridium brassicae]MCY6959372.1 efflux RND transporter permease subunit [Clostridium brassicae]
MNLAKISVKRPVTIFMAVLVVILLGVVSLTNLSVDLLPDINIPIAVVSTGYPNVGPEEVEKLVTKPIEQSIETTPNIKNVKSINSEGSSVVIAEFNSGTDMDFATLDMREKIDMAKRLLPKGSEEPMVLKIDPNAQAVMMISITGGKNLSQLQSFVENNIQPEIERVAGVASAKVSGGLQNEITVSLNQEKLEGYKLSIDYISDILTAENLNLPGGKVNKGSQDLLVRTMGEFKSIQDIEDISIPLKTGGVVLLKDIATVQLGNKEQNLIAIDNGKNCISINIQKQSDSNTVQVSKKVKKQIEILQGKYPDTKIKVLFDQADYINSSIKNVENTAVLGGILAVLILFVFLRNIKSTLIIGTAIPISIIATFVLLYFADITLNLMTLGGLALGVGMLVDNAIVVLENIYRFIQEGRTRKEAAVNGASEVGASVIASTLTTVAVFLPIAFTSGITGELFKDLALTVVFSLVASLVVSLTFIPMLASILLNESKIIHENDIMSDENKKVKINGIFHRVESRYRKILDWSLSNRKKTIFVGMVIFIISMVCLSKVGAEFFPESDQGMFTINVELPDGASINDTRDIVNRIEKKSEKIKEIDTFFVNIGEGDMSSGSGNKKNTAQVIVKLKPLKERELDVKQIMDKLRKESKDIAGAKISFKNSSGMSVSGSAPISIEIKGENLDTLKEISNKFKNTIESVAGTREVESSLGDGKPELRIKLNRKIASQYNLTASQISSQIHGTISGKTATTYKYKDEDIDVVVKGDEIYKQSVTNLKNIMIQSPTGANIPLNLVADVEIKRGPAAINRNDQVRVVSVTSQILGRDLKSVAKDVESKLQKIKMPSGYTYNIGGENEDMQEAFIDLSKALVAAIILVYMVLAGQFESLLNPFVIMFSVPLALAGGALGLFFTERSLCVPAFIGVIILAGIVVNNAIVLIDYINIRRKRGEDRREAVLAAGPIRLRPILMTASTTILGLAPMAFGIGDGAEIQAPMATVVIGGLLFSTILTLIYIPVLYTIFEDLKNKIIKKEKQVIVKN